MKQIYFAIIGLLFVSTIHAQTTYQSGIIRGTTSDNTRLTDMEFDEYDYHVLSGTFMDSVHYNPFGPGTLIGAPSGGGVHNAFFTVYDDGGYPYYAKKLGNSSDSVTIYGSTFNYNGDVAICGTFKGTVDFADNIGSPFYLTSTGTGSDGFIAVYDYMGTFMYAAMIESNGSRAVVTDVKYDQNLNIVAVGYFDGTVDLDPSGNNLDFISTGLDGFVITLDGALSYISSVVLDGAGNQVPKVLQTDWTDIMIGGTFELQMDFDLTAATNSVSSNGGKDIFMFYMDPTYTVYSSLRLGGAGNDKVKDFYYNYMYGFYVLADFEQTVNFNPNDVAQNLTSAGSTDVAVLLYNSSFILQNASQFGNANANNGYRIVPNEASGGREGQRGGPMPKGTIVTLGFNGTMDVDPSSNTVNAVSSNTPVNTVIINLTDTLNYSLHGTIEAESVLGIKGMGLDGNDITMAGNFAGSNVDILPYNETFDISHSGAKAIHYTKYYRCKMEVDRPYIVEPFECGAYNAKLGIEVLSGAAEPIEYWWSLGYGDWNSSLQYPSDAYQDNDDYYSVYVTDYLGCSYFDSLWVRSHDTIAPLDMSLTINPSTCGNNFGSATAIPINILGNASYYWSNGDITATADSLLAGNYFVHLIDDSLMCYYNKTFFIDNSDGPQISVNSSVDPNCGSVNDGSIDVTVTGGATPYTYLWTNGATTEDISGLPGGTYTLTVTDAAGCENNVCVTLYQPSQLDAWFYTSSSQCFTATGWMTVEAYGGNLPYTYQWDAAAGNSTIDSVGNLAAGIYSVTISDANGCNKTFTYGISDWDGPYAYNNWVTNPNCLGNSGFIDMYSYDWNWTGILTYQWATGETTEDIAVNDGGTYHLLVTDGLGCKGYSSVWVYEELPMAPQICMVTVDSTATKNVVVWDKSTTQEADYYNIYREGFCNSNDFGIVGSVDFDSLSAFYDTVVNSDTRTWRYYVTAVDTCGNESGASDIHRTIHLTSQFNSNYDVNLDWSDYVGMPIFGYKIYRRQPTGTAFDYVDSVGALSTNYMDTINFAAYTEVVYFVDAIPVSPCNATRAYNQNEARSNHSRNAVPQDTSSTIQVDETLLETSFNLFPNPTNDQVNLQVVNGKTLWKLELTDQTGRVFLSGTLRDRAQFSTVNMAGGIYFIRLTSENNETKVLKLMVAH